MIVDSVEFEGVVEENIINVELDDNVFVLFEFMVWFNKVLFDLEKEDSGEEFVFI